ncbi:Globoside alpha-1,3-N-acetylgalactosaminyltransferase 1 [Fukomys damarensis]|uniref:Globoside alpha-1,3-N-acetylgalactosaminyltransferase 1 n=1 Tax=Fukomys damarensis TaxID=885580 RepID=A0A091E9R8_FUKDA|nr:Globoside alpha-1,3-N-acetylgalactosaminyltransferase 1 [Fukomys damarensis]
MPWAAIQGLCWSTLLPTYPRKRPTGPGTLSPGCGSTGRLREGLVGTGEGTDSALIHVGMTVSRPPELLTLAPWLVPIVSEGTFDSELLCPIYQLLNLSIGATVFTVGKSGGLGRGRGGSA